MKPGRRLEPRERVLARCASRDLSTREKVEVALGELLTRLLLFESHVIDSIRLQEFPELVRLIGVNSTLELLNSDALEISFFALSIGQVGQTSILDRRMKHGVLPLLSYSFDVVRMADPKADLIGCLDSVEKETQELVGRKPARRLKHAIWNHMVHTSDWDSFGHESIAQLESDLASGGPIIHRAVQRSLDMKLGHPGPIFNLQLERLDAKDFKVLTDVGEVAGLDDGEAHKVVERGLLAVGGLNLRFEEMKAFGAVGVLVDEDVGLLDTRLDFLAAQVDPSAQEARFHRVIRIADVPDMSDPSEVSIEKLIEIRDSEACREFRRWLRGIDGATDAEIDEMFRPIRDRLSKAVRHPIGRAARFATTGAVGLIPGIGLPAGVAIGALDTFALVKLLPAPGPTAFLAIDYRSIFDS